MKQYLLPEKGRFYKANLHTHTTVSDGALTPEEVKALYQKYGYSVVAYTDHTVFVPHNDLTDEHFVALNGFEGGVQNEDKFTLFGERKTAHICYIAYSDQITDKPQCTRVYTGESISHYIKTIKDAGFFATYNHPGWSHEDYSDYMAYHGMDALELFNGSSIVEGYDDYNPRVYDDMLRGGKRIYCIGADDNHNRKPEHSRGFDSARAFTMIKAEGLDYPSVMEALKCGHFYASDGPEIYDLYVEDGKLHVKCSPADRINCTYGIRKAQTVAVENGVPVTEAVFTLPTRQYGYVRVTVIDERGRHACSNAYFEDEMITS